MEARLGDYLAGGSDPADLTITYHVGGGLSGETDLVLGGRGDYRVWSTVTADRQRHDYTGEVPVSEVQALVGEMLRVRLWEVEHVTSERGLDNPEARIEVRAGGAGFAAVLWVSEIDDVPPFDEIQEQVLALVRRVSDGAVLEVGR